MSNSCLVCGKILTADDVGLYKKMISRAAEEYLCKACLARELNCSLEYLDKKIERFKAEGCTLFV